MNRAGVVACFAVRLGLKLESTRGPVEVLVIDSAAPPAPNGTVSTALDCGRVSWGARELVGDPDGFPNRTGGLVMRSLSDRSRVGGHSGRQDRSVEPIENCGVASGGCLRVQTTPCDRTASSPLTCVLQ